MSIMFSWEVREAMAPLRNTDSLAVVYRIWCASSDTGELTHRVMAMMGVLFSFMIFMHSTISVVAPE